MRIEEREKEKGGDAERSESKIRLSSAVSEMGLSSDKRICYKRSEARVRAHFKREAVESKCFLRKLSFSREIALPSAASFGDFSNYRLSRFPEPCRGDDPVDFMT